MPEKSKNQESQVCLEGALSPRTPRGSCNNARFLEVFLESSLKEVRLRRVLRRGGGGPRRRLESA